MLRDLPEGNCREKVSGQKLGVKEGTRGNAVSDDQIPSASAVIS